jgi:hypothetical protein
LAGQVHPSRLSSNVNIQQKFGACVGVGTGYHRAAICQYVIRPSLLLKSEREPTDILWAEQVGEICPHYTRLKHADREDRWKTGLACETLVVVNRIEIAGCALILHYVRDREWCIHEIGEFFSDADRNGLDTQALSSSVLGGWLVSIAVLNISAINRPSSSRNSMTVTKKVIVPPRLPSRV